MIIGTTDSTWKNVNVFKSEYPLKDRCHKSKKAGKKIILQTIMVVKVDLKKHYLRIIVSNSRKY